MKNDRHLQGGAISLAAGSSLLTDGCQFIANGAARGGAIYGGAANITLINTLLAQNVARTTGGAVFTEFGGSLSVQGSNLTGNQAGALTPTHILSKDREYVCRRRQLYLGLKRRACNSKSRVTKSRDACVILAAEGCTSVLGKEQTARGCCSYVRAPYELSGVSLTCRTN